MATIEVTRHEKFEFFQCHSCGDWYGSTAEFFDNRRADGQTFYCINGHMLSYDGTNEKVQRERNRLKQENARLEEMAAEARLAEEKERKQRIAAERKLKATQIRVGAGVCPCCNRTVSQLARHMQSKHPDTPFVPAKRSKG